MNKRNTFVFIVVFLLAGVSLWVYRSKSKLSTVDEDSRDFRVKDTAAITKIFIADKAGDQATIERTPKGWVVNQKYPCRAEAILNLLEVIRNVEVKMAVPNALKKNVIKFMATNALKVEIYSGDEKIKQYYVGHETDDSQSSYMLLTNLDDDKNYESPYACFIPGFKGFLQPRYIAKETEWRDRVVMNYLPPQVKHIQVNYAQWPDSSFSIEVMDANFFQLKDKQGKVLPFDEVKMRQYLVYFQNISYENLISGRNKKLQDSLIRVKPFAGISIVTQDLKTHVYEFYRKTFVGDVNPELGIKYEYDPDRLFLNFDDKHEWALVQYFVFGKLLISPAYFKPKSAVKK
jgi:hypothetical protein